MRPSLPTQCAIGAVLLFTWSSSAWPAPVLRAPGGGTVRALVIGIDKYRNLGEASYLNGAVADAKDITGALKKVGVRVGDPLIDDQATRENVRKRMEGLVTESKAGDLVIIAYSGHGMRVRGYKRWDGKNRNAYHSQMALSQFSPTDPDKGHEIIVDGEMRAWYARLDGKNVDVLVVMDTCYGGHMRDVVPFAGGMKTRALNTSVDDKIHAHPDDGEGSRRRRQRNEARDLLRGRHRRVHGTGNERSRPQRPHRRPRRPELFRGPGHHRRGLPRQGHPR
jgi:hypothetical protein